VTAFNRLPSYVVGVVIYPPDPERQWGVSVRAEAGITKKATGLRRLRVEVEGAVQGVGFRPFVAELAKRLGLAGFVGNDTSGVFIEVEGDEARLAAFISALSAEPPRLARIDHVEISQLASTGTAGFAIVESRRTSNHEALVAADAGTCVDCLREIRDPKNRRFGYAFTNCTNCGPRYTIVRDVPYDRERTTMAMFTMCAACRAEYDDPSDRRYHAEPVCCPDCGPTLHLLDATRTAIAGDPIAGTVAALRRGEIVAIKGLGGYHLAADAQVEAAVARLRARKHREDRPFALMVADVEQVRRLCCVDEHEEELLTGPAQPIVLLTRKTGDAVATAVAPGLRELGVMLPYSPLHHLLLAAFGGPLVMTSGNLSDEPIAFADSDALDRLDVVADAFLIHNREIETRVDDSVVRSVAGRSMPIRRSRGLAPSPIALPWEIPRPVLACGAELKNTFCLGRGHHAFVSHHIGDLTNYETFQSFVAGIEHLQRLFAITPEVVAYDLHPDYLSTGFARDLPGVDLVGVQHHHAHVASCLADNGLAGPVIGVAFDGTGYGGDGIVWGGEFLIADLATSTRAANLAPVPLPGGAAAIREPWRMAASYLDAAYGGSPPGDLPVAARNAARWDTVRAAARNGVNAPMTSSAGRLFDAVAALLDVRDEVTYEGQAAIELEQLVDLDETGRYTATVSDDDVPQVLAVDLIRSVVRDRASGVGRQTVAARFHRGVAGMIVEVCRRLRERHGLTTVALSGGVFQSPLLLERSVAGLTEAGFDVLTHHRVPPNDGGISLGQAVVAGARDRETG
jgi:hydrogenase maturation protein HypF